MSEWQHIRPPAGTWEREQILERHREAARRCGASYREAMASCDTRPLDLEHRALRHLLAGADLEKLGRHAEAEWYCRAAIELDPTRPNGFKNLGISYASRGEYGRATDAWIAGTCAYPEDPRSLGLLEALLDERPELEREIAGLSSVLEDCRRVVRLVGARSWEP